MSSLLIKGGRIVDPASRKDTIGDIFVVDGVIRKIGKLKEKADEVINAKGLIVTPGLVDMHVHFREPGREDQETILTGSRAALAGGVTSVATMPNTNPIADNQAVIEFMVNRAKELRLVNVFPVGATTKKTEGDLLSEMWEMKRSGAVAVTDDGVDVENGGLLLKALEYAKTHDLLVMSHCETEELADGGVMHEGWVSTDMGLPGLPEVAEDLAAHKSILLARRSGARVHLTHLSTKGAVMAVRDAKKSGMKNVTADVSIQHAVLTDEECRGYNTNAKMYPPLRSDDHVKAIVAGIKNGTVDAITTDHAPHIEPDKIKPFVDAARGTVGLETSFAALYTYLVKPKHITLSEGIALMTYKPARILGQKKGTLAVGADADIALFDIKKEWKVDPTKFYSKGKNSVFAGKKLIGKAVHTIVAGEIKMKDGKVLS